MIDIAAAASAYGALKAAKDMFASLLGMKIDQDVRTKVNEAISKLGDAQDKLFELRDQLSRLQEENFNLKSTVESHREWKSTLQKYELVKTSGGAVVYQAKEGISHYACPNCVERREIQILQDRRVASGRYQCPFCKSEYPVDPYNG